MSHWSDLVGPTTTSGVVCADAASICRRRADRTHTETPGHRMGRMTCVPAGLWSSCAPAPDPRPPTLFEFQRLSRGDEAPPPFLLAEPATSACIREMQQATSESRPRPRAATSAGLAFQTQNSMHPFSYIILAKQQQLYLPRDPKLWLSANRQRWKKCKMLDHLIIFRTKICWVVSEDIPPPFLNI